MVYNIIMRTTSSPYYTHAGTHIIVLLYEIYVHHSPHSDNNIVLHWIERSWSDARCRNSRSSPAVVRRAYNIIIILCTIHLLVHV